MTLNACFKANPLSIHLEILTLKIKKVVAAYVCIHVKANAHVCLNAKTKLWTCYVVSKTLLFRSSHCIHIMLGSKLWMWYVLGKTSLFIYNIMLSCAGNFFPYHMLGNFVLLTLPQCHMKISSFLTQ